MAKNRGLSEAKLNATVDTATAAKAREMAERWHGGNMAKLIREAINELAARRMPEWTPEQQTQVAR